MDQIGSGIWSLSSSNFLSYDISTWRLKLKNEMHFIAQLSKHVANFKIVEKVLEIREVWGYIGKLGLCVACPEYLTWKRRPSGEKVFTLRSYSERVRNMANLIPESETSKTGNSGSLFSLRRVTSKF